jgi:Zn-dependent peptidase ImmA (M78 family)
VLSMPVAARRPVPVEDVARELNFTVVYQAMNGDEDLSGFYLREGARTIIGVNASHPPVRRRFTIAHEIGHALLDRAGTIHIDRAFKLRDPTSALAIDPEEIAANAFAAQLLLPEDEVRAAVAHGIEITDDRQLRRLAREFGVSQQAFVYRLANLGLAVDGQATFG